MIDWALYTDHHAHPWEPTPVEMVAYERKTGGLDVFVNEPTGACPELEGGRVDPDHIFIATVPSMAEVNRVAADIAGRLGPTYEMAVFYREDGGCRVIDRLHKHLQRGGARHLWVRETPAGWELVIRRKDFALAAELVATNANA